MIVDFIESINLTTNGWILACFCAMFIGMAKTGLPGVGILVVPLMAALFGGKNSTGVLLPMLIIADMFAIILHRKNAEWKYIIKLLPWAILGIITGLIVGDYINDTQFRRLIAIMVLISLLIAIWNEYLRRNKNIPTHLWFSASFGLAGGFSTMIGNAAGPVMSVYLLSMKLPKTCFVGTAAWFFAIINLFKLPLQIWVWDNVTMQGIYFNLLMLPAILIGGVLGYYLLKKIPENYFRIFILSITTISTFYLFFK